MQAKGLQLTRVGACGAYHQQWSCHWLTQKRKKSPMVFISYNPQTGFFVPFLCILPQTVSCTTLHQVARFYQWQWVYIGMLAWHSHTALLQQP